MATWIFEPGHTEAGFRPRHKMVTWVRCLFKDIHGKLEFDWGRCPAATFEGEIDATKIWTGEPERDAHLRSADFFGTTLTAPPDVALHGPLGDLALGRRRGQGEDAQARLRGSHPAQPPDFGVSWQDQIPGGGVVASDEIEIVLDIEAIHLGDLEKTGAIECYRQESDR